MYRTVFAVYFNQMLLCPEHINIPTYRKSEVNIHNFCPSKPREETFQADMFQYHLDWIPGINSPLLLFSDDGQ